MVKQRSILARAALSGLAVLALAGCSDVGGNGGAATVTQSPAGLDEVEVTITQGTAVHRFTVEVARTAEEQSRGLMNRAALPPDRGMLFPFAQPRFASFWMRNTLIPLDMIFIRADGSIDRIAENTVPGDETPVVSGGEVSAVLELAGGTAARIGIDESATVRWPDMRR